MVESSAAAAICGRGGGGPMRTGEMPTSQYKAGRRVGARVVSKPVILLTYLFNLSW